jgi:hypothetical protein
MSSLSPIGLDVVSSPDTGQKYIKSVKFLVYFLVIATAYRGIMTVVAAASFGWALPIFSLAWHAIMPMILGLLAMYFLRRNRLLMAEWSLAGSLLSLYIFAIAAASEIGIRGAVPVLGTLSSIGEEPIDWPYFLPSLLTDLAFYTTILAIILIARTNRMSRPSRSTFRENASHFRARSFSRVGLVLLGIAGLVAITVAIDAYSSLYVIAGALAWIALVFFILGLCSLIADLAVTKGRSWPAFFWLSLLFSPLIMWIIAAAISPIAIERETPASNRLSVSMQQKSSEDITAQLQQLRDLKDKGLISEADFEAKKAELLERL